MPKTFNVTTTPIENYSHLLNGSEFEEKGSSSVEDLHFSQKDKRPISLILLFWIPGVEGFDMPLRLASVRVPAGTPIGRVRPLINYMELKLTEIIGPAKRANVVLRNDGNESIWETFYDLPLNGVYYV